MKKELLEKWKEMLRSGKYVMNSQALLDKVGCCGFGRLPVVSHSALGVLLLAMGRTFAGVRTEGPGLPAWALAEAGLTASQEASIIALQGVYELDEVADRLDDVLAG